MNSNEFILGVMMSYDFKIFHIAYYYVLWCSKVQHDFIWIQESLCFHHVIWFESSSLELVAFQWFQMISYVFVWRCMISYVFGRFLMVSYACLRFHMRSYDFKWFHKIVIGCIGFLDVIWFRWMLHDFNWFQLVSIVLYFLRGVACISHDFIWFHMIL